jgi:hypothetical protein
LYGIYESAFLYPLPGVDPDCPALLERLRLYETGAPMLKAQGANPNFVGTEPNRHAAAMRLKGAAHFGEKRGHWAHS